MSGEKKTALLNSFIYEEEKVPRNYGRLVSLDLFLEEVDEGKHAPFAGTGYLVLDGKFIRGSEEWVKERLIPFEGGYASLWTLNEEIKDLQVFWVSETDLLF